MGSELAEQQLAPHMLRAPLHRDLGRLSVPLISSHQLCRIPILVPWAPKIQTTRGWLYPERALHRDGNLLLHHAAATRPGHCFTTTELEELARTARAFERLEPLASWARLIPLQVFNFRIVFAATDTQDLVNDLLPGAFTQELAQEHLLPYLRRREHLRYVATPEPHLILYRFPMNKTDPAAETRKAQYMAHLLQADGRNDPAHPLHGRFTGLYQARAKALVEAERDSNRWRSPRQSTGS